MVIERPAPRPMLENQRDLYENGIAFDQTLPIAAFHDDIVEKIANHSTVLVHGATGCGKTTQIPQYILADCTRKGNVPYIVVTQPRRIAAVSIAQHVCEERNWEFGGLVGYQIGQDSLFCENTRILYCTLGVFLEKLIAGQGLDQMTHVVLDEMHEREEEMDLALLLIRKLQQGARRGVKIIVMSATMEIEKFVTYLKQPPVVEIKTGMFGVDVKYLDDLPGGNIYGFSMDEPCFDSPTRDILLNLVLSFDEREKSSGDDRSKGVVLIFVPGIREISDLMSALSNIGRTNGQTWDILPLHSTVGRREQDRVFADCPQGVRRIIVSTNIAESSVTIPDVRYVIDLCLSKQLKRDETSSFTALRLTWASKSNCEQRKGRTGRMSTGTVYRMVPETFYQNLDGHAVPEMLRIPLHQTILKVRSLAISGTIYDILLDAVDPPDAATVRQSVLELIEAGALSLASGITDPQRPDGKLTSIGRIMTSLPLDLPLKRLIIIAVAFGCVDEAIIIAGCLQSRSFLDVRFADHDSDSFKMKMIWDKGGHSDLLAVLSAFQTWETQKASVFVNKPDEERKWCARYSLNWYRINEASVLVDDIRRRVTGQGLYVPFMAGRDAINRSVSKWDQPTEDIDQRLLLQFVVAGAFYPNYFMSEGMKTRMPTDAAPVDTRSIWLSATVQGKSDQIYLEGVKKFFAEHIRYEPERVQVDDNCRVCAVFRPDEFSSELNVPLPVYLALRLRQNLNIHRIINPPPVVPISNTTFLPHVIALAQAKANAAKTAKMGNFVPVEFDGPFHELEIRAFKPVTPDVQFRTVRISKSSVNSVVVNSVKDARIDRIIVAATIKAGDRQRPLNIDNTTLLPAYAGLLDVLTLTFAPSLKLERMHGSRQWTSYKAGIGKTVGSPAMPLWKDHEIDRKFQIACSDDELSAILTLREAWRHCFAEKFDHCPTWRGKNLPKNQGINRGLLKWILDQDVVTV